MEEFPRKELKRSMVNSSDEPLGLIKDVKKTNLLIDRMFPLGKISSLGHHGSTPRLCIIFDFITIYLLTSLIVSCHPNISFLSD